MAGILIHKVIITDEAKFDYKSIIEDKPFPTADIKKQCEDYISYKYVASHSCYYLRLKYFDEQTDKMLMLFFYKDIRLRYMQFWELKGVCFANDWSEELEDSGCIRVWLSSKIKDLADVDDWAVKIRTNKIIAETDTILFKNILKEVENEFRFKRDKEIARKVAFLQSEYFEHRNMRSVKKVKRHRKRSKQT